MIARSAGSARRSSPRNRSTSARSSSGSAGYQLPARFAEWISTALIACESGTSLRIYQNESTSRRERRDERRHRIACLAPQEHSRESIARRRLQVDDDELRPGLDGAYG